MKTVSVLGLLVVSLPATLALTVVALLRSSVSSPKWAHEVAPKTILLSGGKMTKSLQLARSFHLAGHRVILIEASKYRLTGHRFSRAVDRFYTVPDCTSPGYVDALLDIVRRERVDVYVPVCSPVSSIYDADAKKALSEHCEVVHVGGETVRKLDDKYAFATTAASLGLPVPDSHRITSASQVVDFGHPDGRAYILKSIAYDPVRRMDLTMLPRESPRATAEFVGRLPISEENPWILQEFVRGQEYCTHGTVREGALQVHACCESSGFQINYAMVDRPAIEDWVRRFVGALELTGQVSIDFIEASDGTVYAIECNPRTHSAITMFYNHPGVARAYLQDGGVTITPLESSRATYWLYHELWRMARHPTTARDRLQVIRRGKDAIFDWSDPLPFLMVHHVHIPWLLVQNMRRRRGWIRIDFNIGKLIEAGGD